MVLDEEEIAAGYDEIADHIFESESMYRDTLKLAPDCGGRVLDAGCGQGLLLQMIRRRHASASLAGCDISPRLCEMARTNAPDAEVRVADATRLEPYADEEFDFVFLTGSLEHMVDHLGALKAVHRVLRTGGVVVVAVPNRAWLRYDTWLRHHDPTQPIDDHWFRPEELTGLMEAAGFRIDKVRGVWALFRGDWRHGIENAAAAVFPPLHRRMKCIGVRATKAASSSGTSLN